jgi:predicted DNA-binding transcriptional regulator AlpA
MTEQVQITRVLAMPRRLLNREEASVYVGLSARKFDQLVADGRMPKPTRIDGRTVWDIRKIDEAIDVLTGNAYDLDEWSYPSL